MEKKTAQRQVFWDLHRCNILHSYIDINLSLYININVYIHTSTKNFCLVEKATHPTCMEIDFMNRNLRRLKVIQLIFHISSMDSSNKKETCFALSSFVKRLQSLVIFPFPPPPEKTNIEHIEPENSTQQ